MKSSLDDLEANQATCVMVCPSFIYPADINPPTAINALLPLFLETHTAAMIRNSMNLGRAAVHHLNSGQVPVLAGDQHLYALAKDIQWTWPDRHGEDHFVGGLGLGGTTHGAANKASLPAPALPKNKLPLFSFPPKHSKSRICNLKH